MKFKGISKFGKIFAILMVAVMAFSFLPGESFAETSKVHVIVENTTFTKATADSDNMSPKWSGTLVDTEVELKSDSTMMSVIVDALSDYEVVGADSGYISSINGLAEKEGASGAGWMGTLNDWFVNEGFQNFTVEENELKNGDEIRVMYTCNLGNDLGGSGMESGGTVDKSVKAILFSAGKLDKTFDKDTHTYTLTLPADTTTVKVTPTASNKNYQVRTYLGTQAAGTEYSRTADVSVKNGDVITVVCGDPTWPTMNGTAGDAQTYTFNVVVKAASTTEPILTNMEFSYSSTSSYKDYKWKLTPEFDPDTKEYTMVIPTNKNELYVWTQVSDEYPNATIVATYPNQRNPSNTITKNITIGSGTKPANLIGKNNNSNTLTLTVKSNDENDITEVYTVNIKREVSIDALWFKDENNGNKTYMLEGSTIALTHTFADKTIPDNAKLTVAMADGLNKDEKYSFEISGLVDGVLIPTWDKNGVYEYTVTVTYADNSILPATYKGRFISELAGAKMTIETPPTKTEYKTGEKFDSTGMVVKLKSDSAEKTIDLTDNDVIISPSRPLNDEDTKITITYKGESVTQPITVTGYTFKGEGTEDNPYLLENADDCVALSTAVNSGKTYANKYFKITDNITLPKGWVPIGTLLEGNDYSPSLSSLYYTYFSGHIDGANPKGGNFLLTIPSGEKTLLGCVIDGSLSNLDIYGEHINGYGVMEYYVVGRLYGTPAINITNVNLKSGTHTKMSGFLGGYASGSNTVNITNCTIEEGVVIGDDGTWGDELSKTYAFPFVNDNVQYNDMIGSFGGAFNGNIVNCVSYATVYGRNYVGGLIGFKGQSMGDCRVINCEFGGQVIATGEYVGGIIGSGYSADSAPNTPCVTVQNCLVSGTVTGNDKVGGIIGGNAKTVSCWNNGIGYIRGNLVMGKVTALAKNADVGGIIGYISAINKYNIIKNNYFAETVAEKGIGKIVTVNKDNVYCDTQMVSTADLTNGKAVELLNSAKAGVEAWKQGTNAPELNDNKRVYKVELSKLNGMLETAFQSNEGFNNYIKRGGDLTAYYTDGSSVTVPVSDGITSGPDFSVTETGLKHLCSVIYDGYEQFFGINLTVQHQEMQEQQMNAVKIKLLGDTVHEVNADNVHTLAGGNLTEWLGETTVMVAKDATALDVLTKTAKAYGFTFAAEDTTYGKYVNSVTFGGITLDAASNKQSDGKSYSGWQFTVNGESVLTSLDETAVKEGDSICVYFEDDYSLAYVDTAISAIKAIPTTLTKDNKGKVTDAENSLLYLSPIAMNKVKADKDYHLLTDAQKGIADAKAVDDMINSIDMSADDRAVKVAEARTAYNALTSKYQQLVENLDKLVECEAQLTDEEKAAAVDALIDEIETPITLSSKESVRKARKAYDDLTPAQKNLVENYEALERAEHELSPLVIKEAEDLINALPKKDEITLNDKEAIEEARAAYDELTEDEQKEILKDTLKKLTDAEKAYEKLVPKIGDSNDVIVYSMVLMLSVVALTGIMVYKKRKSM